MKKFSLWLIFVCLFANFTILTTVAMAQDEKIEIPRIICTGSTTPGDTDWQLYEGGAGIYADIDTSQCGFTDVPVYITSLGGTNRHWGTIGATSIYQESNDGFRIYVRWHHGGYLDPAMANEREWHINWIAIRPGLKF